MKLQFMRSEQFGRLLLVAFLVSAPVVQAAVVAPYFYSWGYGDSKYPVTSLLDASNKGIDGATLAFVIAGNGCVATTDGASNAITGVMKNDIAAFQQAGGTLILSFGGADGTYLESVCTAPQMATQVNALIQSSGIKKLDFDVEGATVASAVANSVRSAALASLQATYPDLQISLTLAVDPPVTYNWGTDPAGLSAASLAVIQSAINAGVKLTRVNLMTMDFGDYYANGRTDMGQLAIAAVNAARQQLRPLFPGLTEAQLWSLIGITPMIGRNDSAGEVFTPENARTVTDFAIANGVGLLAYWALQRDQVGTGELGVFSGVNASNFQFWNTMRAAKSGAVVPQTGAWWNASESGRGFLIEQSGGTVVVSGYLYDSAGNPLWFIASGPVGNNSISSAMLTYHDGQTLTGMYQAPMAGAPLGNLTLNFTSPTTLTMTWPGGSETLTRLGFGSGGAVVPPAVGAPQSGAWWNPAEGGRGFSIETQGNLLAIAAYLYDNSGNPIWYLSSGAMISPTRYSGIWRQYADGQAMGAPYRAPQVVNANVGSIDLTFSDATHGSLTLPDGRSIPISYFQF